MDSLKRNWIEKITFSNDAGVGKDAVDAADIPPIIAPVLRGDQIYNTEMEKKSLYLNQKTANTSMYDLD